MKSLYPPRHATLWIDCEFNERGGELISLALVDDHDREFYEALPCANPTPWVAEHVLPVLGINPLPTLARLQEQLQQWLGAYDSVHLVADWPDDVAYFCRALITGPGERINTPRLTLEIRRDLDATSNVPHNALWDARAMRARHLQVLTKAVRRLELQPGCMTCAHLDTRITDEPCSTCTGFGEWAPAGNPSQLRALRSATLAGPEGTFHNASAARARGQGAEADAERSAS